MGIRLSDAQAKVSETTVHWLGESFDVGYHPAAITPELLEDVQAAATSEDLKILGDMLEPTLAWWDLLDDDDKRLPTTAEQIRKTPLALTMAVLEQVQEAMRPQERKP